MIANQEQNIVKFEKNEPLFCPSDFPPNAIGAFGVDSSRPVRNRNSLGQCSVNCKVHYNIMQTVKEERPQARSITQGYKSNTSCERSLLDFNLNLLNVEVI